MAEKFRRKSPEEFLHSIYKINRGRLKIILGAVSGSGKTFHMLLEGNELKKKSIDVVIGIVSASDRPKTVEQIGDLEIISPIEWTDNGNIKQDLDVTAIIERNPEVVLVDSLSHRNRPNALNKRRLDDVLMIMSNNISVLTTINIYELEGVKEVAEKLLGVKVQVDQCLPDNTLAMADEVKLLDVTPEQILNRFQEGSINEGHEEKSKQQNLFRRDNLAVLRELSLRFLAGEVNDELDDYREKQGLIGPSGASELVLVSVQYHWNGSILIRRGQQIAKRLGGELFVVCFRSPAMKLSKDEETFRRSIIKLVDKVGGKFEELPLTTDDVAEEIVTYATNNNVTRIVMGQSKRSRWEEIIHGSIINRILRKTRNMDVFIVADRAEKNGERVIPAKWNKEIVKNPYRRMSHKEVEEKIDKIRRGHLKVYIGAAPGVGKTYTMLREANLLKRKGIDIIIGLIETHARKETSEQIGSLELIQRKKISYKNVFLEEMDTETIIKRNPEVVLVDELAHTNVPGSKNKKRYQDVEEILKAGISVISTMNIQHLESLNDSVEQITGVRVRETVPDHVLRVADEIELIDISPKSLQQRMREGNIYAKEKVEQALNHFFKTGNLIALRELALREVADDVDERLESLETRRTLRGPWRKQEVIFVCVNLRTDSESLIRRGFRIAYRLKAVWYVVYVKHHSPLTEEEERSLENIKILTERLGGIFEMYETTQRRQVVGELVERLKEKNATQVIIGHSARRRLEEVLKGSVVQKLLRAVRHLDVLVVADHKPETMDSNKSDLKY
ncbi:MULTISPECIES: universal stress protein [unclassified Bacillus (in: firmicutes)]|uniref:universal stress protein n=1 Tax=unclassified Bacillus (in: firmicutes) TaxID=185979 RepID=UPI0008EC8723|nr:MULTISPECIES: universal stress protein [unclassified Bacillus (in: firmicutes)]SFA80504.1 two-component system, OmpR family, sensor histidine kinase KdpD [Bacillus sp. UNCCL13]SFQ70590.1 two-component system, OmpR family, sensor histidine kinase KdpD [Bacillus sp. cl95]